MYKIKIFTVLKIFFASAIFVFILHCIKTIKLDCEFFFVSLYFLS